MLEVLRAMELPQSCGSCAFIDPCGGLAGQLKFAGCFSRCRDSGACANSDWTCICRPKEFVWRWREVGGVGVANDRPLRPFDGAPLPPYIPMIRGGTTRDALLDEPIVAVSTFDILKRQRRDGYGPVVSDGADLRRFLRVREDAEVFFSSVADDYKLEPYWAYRRFRRVPDALRALNPRAITVPNFSVFSDAPRIHTVWNLRRMQRAAEELSDAGIQVVLHLNAETEADWQYWTAVLAANPRITVVAKEFSTGLARRRIGVPELERLARIQRVLERPLHLAAIAGGRYVAEIARLFDSYTIVDSTPYMKAVKRKRAVLGPGLKWVDNPTEPGEPLDGLVTDNIRTCRAWLAQKATSGKTPSRTAVRLGGPRTSPGS